MKAWNWGIEKLRNTDKKEKKEMHTLCEDIRVLVAERNWNESERQISNAMKDYPHAAEPHNLYGIILEKEGNHIGAMKHFRAAWALDPTFVPARYNLEQYGSFFKRGECAFVEADCKEHIEEHFKVQYDTDGEGSIVRREDHELENSF